MFNNVGKSIKTVAKVFFGLGVAAAIITSIAYFILGVANEAVIPLLLCFILPIPMTTAAWINSLFIYGFGQLIENSDVLVSLSKENKGEFTEGFTE